MFCIYNINVIYKVKKTNKACDTKKVMTYEGKKINKKYLKKKRVLCGIRTTDDNENNNCSRVLYQLS